jgi:hypothetical protein
LSDVVSRIAVRSSSTAQAAIRFNSCNELEFQYGNFVRKLRDKFRREQQRGQAMEIGEKQQRSANVLCRGAGLKALDPNADKKLMETSWKRRNAMRSSRNAIIHLLNGQRDNTRAWGLCNGSDADHAFDDDNVSSNTFWMFKYFSRVEIKSGEIPGFTCLALDVPKIVIIHDEKAIPLWLNTYIYLGGCFLMSTQFFTTCGKAGFCLKHVPNISAKKTIYIGGCIRDKSPTMVRAIETTAKTPFSKMEDLVTGQERPGHCHSPSQCHQSPSQWPETAAPDNKHLAGFHKRERIMQASALS